MINKMYVTAVLFVLVLAAITEAYTYPSVGNNHQQGPPRCHSPNSPCRMNLTLESEFEDSTHSSAHMCSCEQPNSCPTDWTKGDHVVSKQLISSTYTVVLDLMFCNPVQPDRVCVGGETSIVTSGSLLIPNDLEAYNCRCQDGVPLQLKRRWISNFTYKHEYVCDNLMPTCSMSVLPCVTVNQLENRYICKCPGRTLCHLPLDSVALGSQGATLQLGYCRSPIPRGSQ